MHLDSDNKLTGAVIGGAIAVHRELGPGLDEIAYEEALSAQLVAIGIEHVCQQILPLHYKGVFIECDLRMDVVVDRRLVLELKSLESILAIHDAQLLGYMKVAKHELGLLMNFDVPVMKEGIKRKIFSQDYAQSVPAMNARINSVTRRRRETDAKTEVILDAAIDVHRELGPGLLRGIYEACLCHELALRRIPFERKREIPVYYRDQELSAAAQVPLLVFGEVPVFCMSVSGISRLHVSRLLARLKQGGWRRGLLLNFNVPRLCEGTRRVLNPYH